MLRRLLISSVVCALACSNTEEPRDPCADDPCFDGVVCTASGGNFTCGACPVGLEGNGQNCTEIDGCAGGPCFEGATCTDVAAPQTGFVCGDCPSGTEGDGVDCADIDGCSGSPCFSDVECIDEPAPRTGFSCGACPSGLEGDGQTCTEINGCAGEPCLPNTTCTDISAPGTGFVCTECEGVECPRLRALAGPDQDVIRGANAALRGDAVGFNGRFDCEWSDDAGTVFASTCTATVTATTAAVYTLTVIDASGLSASDDVEVRIVRFRADAGDDRNIPSTWTATLTASWEGASCSDTACVDCEWTTSDGATVGQECELRISPESTTQYFVTVTDTEANVSDSDSATVFVTDRLVNLCGWNVVVMTSDEFPSNPNPNYICDGEGNARRQTINGKPAIVLSDLRVQNVRIVGHIGVETTGDDDLIGFLWGMENPAHAYLLTWKQGNQRWTARCGNALAGISIKKIDGAVGSSTTVSFNSSFGFNATDYVYSCADLWSTDRDDAALLGDSTIFLESPRDPEGTTVGWRDNITYRAEFYYTPTRTKVLIWTDDEMTGATNDLVADFDVVDSSYPEGAFAFFSNSQAQVAFGDFTLASLDDFAARAGRDRSVSPNVAFELSGSADLAVPPYSCEWSAGTSVLSRDCVFTTSVDVTTTFQLTVTDHFGRVAADETTITVMP